MAIDINKLAQVGTMAAGGGYAQAALGGAQALYGLSQLPKAKAEFERAKAAAPSLETPAQFYENYKNAYDGEMARMQNDAIQANLATSVQALQGAGGKSFSWWIKSSYGSEPSSAKFYVSSRTSNASCSWSTVSYSRRACCWS